MILEMTLRTEMVTTLFTHHRDHPFLSTVVALSFEVLYLLGKMTLRTDTFEDLLLFLDFSLTYIHSTRRTLITLHMLKAGKTSKMQIVTQPDLRPR